MTDSPAMHERVNDADAVVVTMQLPNHAGPGGATLTPETVPTRLGPRRLGPEGADR